MADNQHRAAVSLQVVFEPLHRLQVKMVRRLVQNQQVGAFQEQARQAQTGLLTARKHARQLCPRISGKPHAVQDFLDLGVHVIGVHRIDDSRAVSDLFGQHGVVRVGSQLLLQHVHLLHGVQRRGEYQFHRGVDVQRRVKPGILLQVARRHAGAEGRVARVWQALTAENTQERRLAGTVSTDDADAVAALHPSIYIAQYLVFAEALAKVLKFQQHIRYILNSKMMPPP